MAPSFGYYSEFIYGPIMLSDWLKLKKIFITKNTGVIKLFLDRNFIVWPSKRSRLFCFCNQTFKMVNTAYGKMKTNCLRN